MIECYWLRLRAHEPRDVSKHIGEVGSCFQLFWSFRLLHVVFASQQSAQLQVSVNFFFPLEGRLHVHVGLKIKSKSSLIALETAAGRTTRPTAAVELLISGSKAPERLLN